MGLGFDIFIRAELDRPASSASSNPLVITPSVRGDISAMEADGAWYIVPTLGLGLGPVLGLGLGEELGLGLGLG